VARDLLADAIEDGEDESGVELSLGKVLKRGAATAEVP